MRQKALEQIFAWNGLRVITACAELKIRAQADVTSQCKRAKKQN